MPTKSLFAIGGLIAIVFLGSYWYVSHWSAPSSTLDTDVFMANMEQVSITLAKDREAQYVLVKKSGDVMQTCVYARLVTMSYLQAKDEPQYLKWKAIDEADCAAAGWRR